MSTTSQSGQTPPEPEAEAFSAIEPGDPTLTLRPDDLARAVSQLVAARLAASAEPARERILAFCRDHPDALHRSCLLGHLTGSTFVVDEAAERTLLVHHTKLDRWLQPGGHADGDGNLAGVAWREATEETGLVGLRLVYPAIDIDIHRIPERPGEPEHLHLDLRFAVVAPEGSVVAHNHEAIDAGWFDSSDPRVANAPDLARGVTQAFAAVRRLA